jgi:hypothetical protein
VGFDADELDDALTSDRDPLITHEASKSKPNSRPTSLSRPLAASLSNLFYNNTGNPVNISNILSANNVTAASGAGASVSYEARRQSLAEMASQIKY